MTKRRSKFAGDVQGCKYHTRPDERSDAFIRIAPCKPVCHIMRELEEQSGLTRFIAKLLKYSRADLEKANARKAAKHYKIPVKTAQAYIDMYRTQAGIR